MAEQISETFVTFDGNTFRTYQGNTFYWDAVEGEVLRGVYIGWDSFNPGIARFIVRKESGSHAVVGMWVPTDIEMALSKLLCKGVILTCIEAHGKNRQYTLEEGVLEVGRVLLTDIGKISTNVGVPFDMKKDKNKLPVAHTPPPIPEKDLLSKLAEGPFKTWVFVEHSKRHSHILAPNGQASLCGRMVRKPYKNERSPNNVASCPLCCAKFDDQQRFPKKGVGNGSAP